MKEIKKQERRSASPKESVIIDIIEECRKIYQDNNGNLISPAHLRALASLCAFGKERGLDCEWIYEAFKNELHSKYETILINFYMGAFVQSMLLRGASLNQTKKAIKEWTGMSPRQVEKCQALFKAHAGFNMASPCLVMSDQQILAMASGVINSIKKPYLSSGKNLEAFNKLKEAIIEAGFNEQALPFEHDYTKKRRG